MHMTSLDLNMIQTAGIGALALLVGMVLTRKVAFLQRFCIPSPVSGGIIFSLLGLALYGWFHVELSFDDTLKDIFMLAFFTSVGFQSDMKVLKQGGKALIHQINLLLFQVVLPNNPDAFQCLGAGNHGEMQLGVRLHLLEAFTLFLEHVQFR